MGWVNPKWYVLSILTHWSRVTHICVGNLPIIGSDNGLSSDRRQAIFWTNAGKFLIGPLGTNFSEILIKIITFSFKKMRSKVSSGKRRPSCLGLNLLTEMTSPWREGNVTKTVLLWSEYWKNFRATNPYPAAVWNIDVLRDHCIRGWSA